MPDQPAAPSTLTEALRQYWRLLQDADAPQASFPPETAPAADEAA